MLTYLTTKSMFYWYVSAKTFNSSTSSKKKKKTLKLSQALALF